MDIIVYRQPVKGKPTMGEMHIDGEFFCYTLEDEDRGIIQGMSLARVKQLKIYAETCIGYGTYKVKLTYSPTFKRILPLIIDVVGFLGIRMHRLNWSRETKGCIGVGFGVEGFMITHSKDAEDALIKKMEGVSNITLNIRKK